MKRIVTVNSVYEVDEEKKLVRRAENAAHIFDHGLSSGEWEPYHSFVAPPEGATFFLCNEQFVFTSPVTSVEEV
jgi:hypothetical protein